jgi:uncharacterized SAM-binding protein YcdF (DUF218 family)
MDERIRALARTVWDYHRLGHDVAHADAILVLCSHDTRVAERAADLFLEGRAPWLIFSGGLGSITRRLWQEPEADRFAARAIARGVPAGRMLIENRSTNTGENIQFTQELLDARGLVFDRFIVVQKPYMERRSYATFKKRWPGKEIVVTSPQVSMEEYLASYANAALSADDVVSIMVGDLQRIREYPKRGFQIEQEIPEDVWKAFHALVDAGYDRHLITEVNRS